MKYKIVKQPDEMNCGVACLSMICAYYGVSNMSLSIIRNFAQTDREGNSIYSLVKAAEKLNMEAKAYTCTRNVLLSNKVKFPIIVHTLVDGLYNHYMVLFEVNRNNVVLGDPANGLVKMKWEEFEKIWTKKIITFKPTENFEENKKYKRNYKIIIRLILKFKKQLIIMAVFTGIISGISAITTQFYSYLIDTILPRNNIELLFKAILLMCGMFFLTVQLNLMKQKFSIKFNKALDKELIINIYDRITNLPMSFFSSRTNGDIAARYEDGDSLRSVITDFSLEFVTDVGYAIWALILLLTINWQMCVVAIVMEELMILVQVLYKKKLQNQNREIMQASVEVNSFVISSFSASETVKNYNAEKVMEDGMERRFKKYQDKLYKSQLTNEVQSNIVSTINNLGNIFMLGLLGIFVMNGNITVGELVKAYMFVNYLFGPIGYIMGMQEQMYETAAVLERLDDVFNTTTEEELDKKKKHLNESIETIKFENVSFRYGMRSPILKDISFEVNKGESIGIIGSSGCGKTTLIKLILGFFPVSEGQITINGADINKYTSSSIRKKMAYVSQNDFWFKDTIYNNLTIGNQNANVSDLDKVCEMVRMTDYINKSPYGYNSIIEENGDNLSSGEKQRFSIAKALITNPEVLILDESTSNLDANTEEFVVEELRKEQDKIKIIIAHRLNTLIHCNKVIAIDQGRIVEVGTPAELLKKKGMFYDLWKIQNKVFETVSTKK